MVSEAVGFIGILLLAAAIIIGVYFWITVRLNGQTPDEYLNESVSYTHLTLPTKA